MSDTSIQSVETAQTPLMRQYAVAKQQHPDALLFFRLGDFYELFFEDAHVASRELQITLTARDKERAVPMCGVPYHAAENYISRLLRKGYRVAICEQMEDPKLTKKIVRREVTRVLTPGTAIDPALGSEQNNFLAAVSFGENLSALALLDLSTGDFRAAEFTGPEASALCLDEMQKVSPSEVLFPAANPLLSQKSELPPALDRIKTKTPLEDWVFTRDYAVPLLERQLGAASLDGFGLSQHPAAAIAAGAILHYVRSTQRVELGHIDSIRFYERAEHLQLDQVTVRNLELVEPIFSEAGSNTTLFHALDHCQTPMGKRMLRSSLLRPLFDEPAIHGRYDAVDHLKHDLILREKIRKSLEGILDLERLLARISLDSAGPRDLLTLAASLQHLPQLRQIMSGFDTSLWEHLTDRLDPLEDLCAKIQQTVQSSPPLTLAEGGVIAGGVDAELDELRTLSQSGRQSVAAIEERERTRTGIGSLKVRFNSVFGYYIEITKANLVPACLRPYELKYDLVNAEPIQ